MWLFNMLRDEMNARYGKQKGTVWEEEKDEMCIRDSWLKLFKKCGWKKNKKHKVGNECRLTRCPFVVLFLCPVFPVKMVYFFDYSVRYFLSGRCLLRLHTTSNLRNKYTTFVYIKLITFVYYFLI